MGSFFQPKKSKNKSLEKNRSFHLARQEGLCPGAARTYRLATLVAPSAKTVRRTVFFRRFAPPSLFESLLRNFAKKTKSLEPVTVQDFSLARQEGLEPPTFWFVAKHSIRLSYWRICFCQSILSQTSRNVKSFFAKRAKFVQKISLIFGCIFIVRLFPNKKTSREGLKFYYNTVITYPVYKIFIMFCYNQPKWLFMPFKK